MSKDSPDLEAAIPATDCLDTDYREQLARDVCLGLGSEPKTLPSKYFYDSRGSRLFEEICGLPEYYPTRFELQALRRMAPRIMREVSRADLIELGSGASRKIAAFLQAADGRTRAGLRYVPVDVCGDFLQDAARELLQRFPELSVQGIIADFTRHLGALPDGRQRVFFFLGGTLGNFPDGEALGFLSGLAGRMRPGDHFLLGLDMRKDKQILERAYNDARGVTAAFNRNVLRVINRELNARFDPERFGHLAFFNPVRGRVEMHLRAERDMEVRIGDLDMLVPFRRGETIHTEISRKFSPQEIQTLAGGAGLSIRSWITVERDMFSLLDLVVR
jgi:L-histidine N-alpha-methyltransferase